MTHASATHDGTTKLLEDNRLPVCFDGMRVRGDTS
jgi:hypothetical protein